MALSRPAMRAKEARKIRERLKRHHELMGGYETKGIDRLEASELAYRDLLEEERNQ